MKIIVKCKTDKSQIYFGEYKNIQQAKQCWSQGDIVLENMIKNKEVTFHQK